MSLLLSGLGFVIAVVLAGWLLIGGQSMGKKPGFRRLVLPVMLLVTSAPVSVLITLFLIPLWRWLEAAYGIESIGHSGPAGWCYVVTFLACLVIMGWAGIRLARRRADGEAA